MMANSIKTQATKIVSSWEDDDFDTVDTVEKQMSKVKILSRFSQEKNQEAEQEQSFKPVPEASGVIIVSPEEQHRTQYIPESKVLIMKRPTQDGLGNSANNKPKHPVKTLEQRQAEYKEARLRILGNAEPEEKKGSVGGTSNSDDSAGPEAEAPPAVQGTGSSSVAQGAQRGIITGPAARQQQQQQQQSKKQAKRNFNSQQTSAPSQPQAPFANSQFNPCAPPFQHSSMTNGNSNNSNNLHPGVAVCQQQVFPPTQPPPMSAAPPTMLMAQYMPGQQYHQSTMGSHPPYPHGMPPPPAQQHSGQFVGPNDMPTVAYMQQPQQGAGVYRHHHPQQHEQQYVPQQQFFQPHLQHYPQMQHSLQYMQMGPPMPPHLNHQPPIPQQPQMHQQPMQQQPMQQQYPPSMIPHQTFQPPRPQYIRPLGSRPAFPPTPSREEAGSLTNGGSSISTETPSPTQQPPVVARPTPREKSPVTAVTTFTAATTSTTSADSSNNNDPTATSTTTATTNSKGNKKGNKNKTGKGKAYSTTRNSYTIKQRPKEDDSVSWRVKPAEIVLEQNDSNSTKDRRSDSSPENKANGIETSKTDRNSSQERPECPEGDHSTSPKDDIETPKDETLEPGSTSPVTVVKAKKKTKRGKKKNTTAATALTVAISTNTVARSNCKDVNSRIVRMPRGPDGTKGFNFVR